MSGYRIHTYTAAEAGLLVNSYLVEAADGVVLIDANLLLSDVRALGARLAALHKPLLGVFVTHAHPDHFNGLPPAAGSRPWTRSPVRSTAPRCIRVTARRATSACWPTSAGTSMMYREAVGRIAAGAPALTDAQRDELTTVMTRFLPGAPLAWMIGPGADAVAGELAGDLSGAAEAVAV